MGCSPISPPSKTEKLHWAESKKLFHPWNISVPMNNPRNSIWIQTSDELARGKLEMFPNFPTVYSHSIESLFMIGEIYEQSVVSSYPINHKLWTTTDQATFKNVREINFISIANRTHNSIYATEFLPNAAANNIKSCEKLNLSWIINYKTIE